eukprot:CAMPEP_0198293896 /NCGR_PEP_ID=MMETSP1449-20131203/19418_1 /TAXON_ID=420275 /ORGANISM="Attheya septentrionalis, Strain CCMP2084" /LENGTH=690 /DNA_ID=CAMNT_0043993649 /DNA_START=95 /DNA_END=2167 /DNA_ORIENTATION=+
MAGRDPFPMSSPEAKRLAGEESSSSSTGQELASSSSSSTDWHRMGTTSTGTGTGTTRAGPLLGDDAPTDGAGASLLNETKKQKKKQRGSIYDELEAEKSDSYDEDEGDSFLDVPLGGRPDSLASLLLPPWMRVYCCSPLGRLLKRVYAKLYGNSMAPGEMGRTLTLSATLFFMIGGYWLLRSLKDPVLTALCGVSVIPKAKMLSVFVVLGVVSIYNRLLDSDLEKHKLFYVFGTFYFCLFATISLALAHPTIGLANQTPDPWRVLGWISYCGIESFGSVMVSLFWSFANSNFSLEGAKASYGFMVATAQIGSIIGPTIVTTYASTWGVAKIYFVGALCMLLLQATMALYIHQYGPSPQDKPSTTENTDAPKKKKEKAGVLEGIHLFIQHHYVKGIFAISCLFMVEVTIVDYTMKVLARDYFADLHPCEASMSCWDPSASGTHGMSQDATAAFTTFMGLFGQATNTLSFLMSLLGTSAIIRYLGLRLTLLLFPSLCLVVIIFVRFYPTLYVVFTAMMMLKASSYALNNPTKEMLYQPTSPAVRYKAKSWIDIFGARGSKALGSVVTNAFSNSAESLVANGSLVGMAVASFLIWNARYMGHKFDEYMASGHIVGTSDEDDDSGNDGGESLQMAMKQNKRNDTSCAIIDNDEDDEDDDELGAAEEGQGYEDDADDDEEDLLERGNGTARITTV